jgi:uncharacterized membrane protein
MLIKAVQWLSFSAVPVPILGSAVSTLIFLWATTFVASLARNAKRDEVLNSKAIDAPNLLGWLLLIWSPASYVFHTHHTESLFFLLSLVAVRHLLKDEWIMGAVVAGLCALTKNQGIFLAFTVGCWSALNAPSGTVWAAIKRFMWSGLISGGLFSLYPLYCYFKTGDALAFYHAQLYWRPEMTEGSYFKSLIFANPWQNTNSGSLLRYGFFWILALGAIWLAARRHISGLFCLLFVGIMPISGEFVGTFRYSSVLFPIWFLFGSALANLSGLFRYLVMSLIGVVILYLNFDLFRSYLLLKWSY